MRLARVAGVADLPQDVPSAGYAEQKLHALNQESHFIRPTIELNFPREEGDRIKWTVQSFPVLLGSERSRSTWGPTPVVVVQVLQVHRKWAHRP